MFPPPHFLRPALLVAATLICIPAIVRADPTADQIINALKPGSSDLTGPTRGIRVVAPTGKSAQPGKSAPPGKPAQTTTESGPPSIDLSVEFRSGSADLTPAAVHVLAHLGVALASPVLAADRFRIEGHTDTVGSPELNKALSQRRADAVATYLETKYGIAAVRLNAQGLGEDGLLVPTPDQTPEPRNRRVHIVNLGA
jgi:outer membrane protein OmpA-like peptidoglycan-associated protein